MFSTRKTLLSLRKKRGDKWCLCRTKAASSSSGATASFAANATTATTGAPKPQAGNAVEDMQTSVPIGLSLLATLLGVTTVSIAAGILEQATASSAPSFDPKGQRFNAESFQGRFSRMLLACDPRLLLHSQTQVQQAKQLIQNWEVNEKTTIVNKKSNSNNYVQVNDNRTLWEAKRIVDNALHPDTGDVIPRPFRMSGYVTFNGPICVAMIASPSTVPLLFWSWVNQSQNALVNYYNRNASSPMSTETLLKSYGAAVGAALLVAFGLATTIQKRYNPVQARRLLRWVAFPSAVVASSLNCYIVRSPEIGTGIALLDEDGNDVLPGATSQVAATRGVHSTTLSRAMLQVPVYFIPPLLISTGPIKHYLAKHPIMTVPITTYLLMVCSGIGLPATVGFFPQIAKINVQQVEDKFQHLKHPKTDQPYQVLYYNKGL